MFGLHCLLGDCIHHHTTSCTHICFEFNGIFCVKALVIINVHIINSFLLQDVSIYVHTQKCTYIYFQLGTRLIRMYVCADKCIHMLVDFGNKTLTIQFLTTSNLLNKM